MKRHALVLAGLLSLCAALPAWAQPINSTFIGQDITNSLPFGASTTPSPSQITSFLQSAVGSLQSLFGINNSSTQTTTSAPVIATIPGTPGAMILPTSGPVVAPYPEQLGTANYLNSYFGMRRLYP